ncbi:MAG: tetraacyldisaccharide 4'-kinase [Phycisphaerales bacterium]
MTPEGTDPREATPLRGALGRALARVAAPMYGVAIGVQNWRFDRGIGVGRAAVPVVSVGNLTAGGTGKTPLVVWLSRELRVRGLRPAVALRGYRPIARPAGAGGDGALILGRWSDEVDELHRALPGTPIVARARRLEGIEELLEADARRRAGTAEKAIDVVILDDGFQHRRLARDFDLVVIDSTRDPRRDELLPAGWLREPVESLSRAQAVVLNRFDEANAEHLSLRRDLADRLSAPIFCAGGAWAGIQGVPGVELAPVSFLEGKRLVVACGIGNPAAFLRQVRAAAGSSARAGREGAGAVTALFYPDHHAYPKRSVYEIAGAAERERADAIVVTDKDWSKLRLLPAATWPCAMVRPLLTMSVDGGAILVDRVEAAIRGSAARSTRR